MPTDLPSRRPQPLDHRRLERIYEGYQVEQPPPRRSLLTTWILAGIAWIATVALAFMLGRASVEPVLQPRVAATSAAPALGQQAPFAAPSPIASPTPILIPTPSYPKFTSAVPASFRGSWDEIVSDRCEGREARYTITATTFSNFEVHADVERVKLISPTKIELSITGYDEDKNQFNSTIGFRLVDDGKALTTLADGGNNYRRCPA